MNLSLASRSFFIYTVAGFFSLLLSCYASYHVDVINPDGFCYLKSAEGMSQGLHYAMHLCAQSKWAFYSGLIFLLAKATHLGFIESAYLLNSFFSLITVFSFIGIVQHLNNKPRLLWLAALVILSAHQFNALRDNIIRDHGFMAFYLLSLLCLLKYFRSFQWRFALGWNISLVIATLFRIEAAVFLLLLPFVTVRIKAFLKLYALTIMFAVLLGGWLFLHPTQDLNRLSELQDQLLHSWQQVSENFLTRANNLGQYVLISDSLKEAPLVLSLTFLSWYFIQVVTALSLIYSALVMYAWVKVPSQGHPRRVLWGYIAINVLITLIFLVERLFLSKRYLMGLSLVLMIWVPFALDYLIAHKKKWLLWAVFMLMLISFLGGIIRFGYSKNYIREAGVWLSMNVPPSANLYINDFQLMYYSQHFGDGMFKKFDEYINFNAIKQGNFHQYDYLALRDKHNHEENNWAQKEAHLSPVKIFSNAHGDQVIIYKISH